MDTKETVTISLERYEKMKSEHNYEKSFHEERRLRLELERELLILKQQEVKGESLTLRYMRHVDSHEGVCFTSDLAKSGLFTSDEIDKLRAYKEKIYNEQ